MNIVGLAGIGIVIALISQMLKRYNPELAMGISLCAGIFIALLVVAQIVTVVGQVEAIFSKTGLSSDYSVILLKSLGICFLAQFASDACRDVGESSLAGKIELAGRTAVVVLALPLFQAVLNIAVELIG